MRSRLRGGLRCVWCGGKARNRHVALLAAQVLGLGTLTELRHRPDLRVLNTMSGGSIGQQLAGLAHVDNTAYWDDVEPGQTRGGVRCEDLTALTHADATFDLVITEDVLEHIPAARAALGEIHRVLAPGGHHVFSIPYHIGRPSEQLFDRVGEEIRLHEPVRFHADPIAGRVPVYHRFGYTLLADLDRLGFRTRAVASNHADLRRHAIVDCLTFISVRR